MSSTPDARPEAGVSWKVLGVVFLTLFLDLVGFGLILPVLPFYAVTFGASPAVVAMLSTAYSVAQFVMAPVLGRTGDRYGRRPVMLISIAGSCVAMLVLGFASSLAMVFVARFVTGMSSANISTAQAIVADRVSPEERAKYMGMMGAAIGLGFVFGPALGGLLWSAEAPARPFLVAAGLAAVNWMLAWRFLPETRRADVQARHGAEPGLPGPLARFVQLFRIADPNLRTLVLCYFVFNLAFSAMEATFALLMDARLGWGERETGALFTEIGFVIIVVQGVVVGRLVRRVGEKRTLVVGLAILAIGLATTGSVRAAAWIATGSAAIAAGNGLVVPTLSALVSRASGAHEQGVKLGVAASAASLARIVGPLAAGLAFEMLGPGTPMQFGAALVVGLAGLVVVRVVSPARVTEGVSLDPAASPPVAFTEVPAERSADARALTESAATASEGAAHGGAADDMPAPAEASEGAAQGAADDVPAPTTSSNAASSAATWRR